MTRETHSLRRASPLKPITPATDADENHIHRCQAVRAVYHPAFRHPDDASLPHLKTCSSETEWLGAEPFWRPTSRGALLTCSAGLALIEIDVDGRFKTHIEYIDPSYGRASNGEVAKSTLFSAPGESSYPPTSLLLTLDWIRNLVGFDPMSPTSPEVKLNAVGCNLRSMEMDSYRRMAFAQPLRSLPGIPDLASAGFGREVRNGPRTKVDDDQNHRHYAFLLNSAWNGGPSLIEVDVSRSASSRDSARQGRMLQPRNEIVLITLLSQRLCPTGLCTPKCSQSHRLSLLGRICPSRRRSSRRSHTSNPCPLSGRESS